jgi:DNA-directed RNA polymerase specialized sigma24 family protein
MARHLCSEVKGEGLKCGDCPIKRKGFCPDPLMGLLSKWEVDLSKSNILEHDGETILAETIAAITPAVKNFRGRSKFSTWAWQIFKFKKNDYYREKYKSKIYKFCFESLALEMPQEILNQLAPLLDKEFSNTKDALEAASKCLKKDKFDRYKSILDDKLYIVENPLRETAVVYVHNKTDLLIKSLQKLQCRYNSNNIEFLITVLSLSQKGNEREFIAKELDIQYNTITKRISRMLSKIQKEITEEEYMELRLIYYED